jgi:hypothetical protein
MPNASIAFSASVNDGTETKSLSSSGTIGCTQLVNGSQTVGNTYEVFATAYGTASTVIIYNTGAVDASIRVTLGPSATNDYQFLNCIAGGMVVVPQVWGDGTERWSALHARSDSGTVLLDYCIIR